MNPTLETVKHILDDKATDAEKIERIKLATKDPDIFDELSDAFPNEFPEILAQWKTLTTKTWDTILSRPKAWKIALKYLNKTGIKL